MLLLTLHCLAAGDYPDRDSFSVDFCKGVVNHENRPGASHPKSYPAPLISTVVGIKNGGCARIPENTHRCLETHPVFRSVRSRLGMIPFEIIAHHSSGIRRKLEKSGSICTRSTVAIRVLIIYRKALLQEADLPFGRTHHLIALLDLLVSIVPSWELLGPQLQNLNAYSVAIRYPGESADKIAAGRP